MKVRLAVLLVGIILAMPGRVEAQNTSEPGRELLQACLDHLFGKGTGAAALNLSYKVIYSRSDCAYSSTVMEFKGVELQTLQTTSMTLTLSLGNNMTSNVTENHSVAASSQYRDGLGPVLCLNPAWVLNRLNANRDAYIFKYEPGCEASFIRSGFQNMGAHSTSPGGKWEERVLVGLDSKTILEYRYRIWGINGIVLKEVWVLFRQLDPSLPKKWEVVQSSGEADPNPVRYNVELSR